MLIQVTCCYSAAVVPVEARTSKDFIFNKRTGEIRKVNERKGIYDRILKSDRYGNVKRKGDGLFGFLVRNSNKGTPKIEIDNIEKGILKDHQNWRYDDQLILVDSKGQPSLAGVEDFITRFSDYLSKEIVGAYLSLDTGAYAKIGCVYIDEYDGNGPTKSSGSISILKYPTISKFNIITDFHTHLSLGRYSRTEVERPSPEDIAYRDRQKRYFYKFIILTRDCTYPSSVQKVDYTVD